MSCYFNTVQKSFYLTNIVGAEIFEFSENFKIEVKWNKIDSSVFEVEVVDVFGTFDCTNYKYELGTKFSSTTIETLSQNKYKATLTAWNPIFLKATFPLKKVQLLNPDFITLFHLPLPEEAMEKLGINQYSQNTITVFEEIVINYIIRRDTASKYVVEIKCDKYKLKCENEIQTYHDQKNSVWSECIEFELKKLQFTKPPAKFQESTVIITLDKDATKLNRKVSIFEQGTELDVDKVQEYAVEKYGTPDYAIKTADNEEIGIYKNVLEENSKVFKNMFENSETAVGCDAIVFHHVLAYVYGKSLEFHGLEMELINFAKDFEMGDLMEECITSLGDNLSEENLCKITKFAYENGISKLLRKCQESFLRLIDRDTKISKEELQTITFDMIYKTDN